MMRDVNTWRLWARDAARLAAASYGSASEWDRYCRGPEVEFETTAWCESGPTQVPMALSSACIAIVPRGSDAAADWRDNFNSWRVPWPGTVTGRVNYGHLRQVRRVEEQFLVAIRNATEQFPEAEIWVIGHSLGGVLAALLCAVLRREGYVPNRAWGFGMPRPGNEAFAEWFDAEFPFFERVVLVEPNGHQDVITRLPPSAFGWRHVSKRLRIIHDGRVYVSEWDWQRFRREWIVDPVKAFFIATRLRRAISAHSSQNMVQELSQRLVLAEER